MTLAGELLLLAISLACLAGTSASYDKATEATTLITRVVWYAACGVNAVLALGCFLLTMSSVSDRKK